MAAPGFFDGDRVTSRAGAILRELAIAGGILLASVVIGMAIALLVGALAG